jgi:hypothetical protein
VKGKCGGCHGFLGFGDGDRQGSPRARAAIRAGPGLGFGFIGLG